MIRGIFFDVDGTLISRKRSYISDSVIEVLKKLREQGIKLFIATGRHYIELEKLGINKQFTFDGYLTLNGGYFFNHKEAIYSNPINKDDVIRIVEYTTKHNLACSFVETDDMYLNKIDDLVIEAQIFLNTSLPLVKDITRVLNNDIYQIDPFVTSDEIKNIMALTKHCKYTQWYEYGYDVIPKAGGKHEGIKAMLEYYGFDKSEIMVFGDGHNDIEMLVLAGIGVCMGNGHKEAKKVSDFITKSVDEDGIVTALDYFSLI